MIILRFFYFFSIYFLLISDYSIGETKSPISTLKLTSEAQVFVPADLFSINLEVITEKLNAESALTENNSKINTILKNLIEIGINKKEIQTSQFSISPIYSNPPKNPSESWVAEIKGYRVSNSITVKTDNFSLAGKIVDTANHAGANSVNNLQFLLKNPKESRLKAIKAATANAIEDANALADSAGVTINKILSINLNPNPHPLYKTMMLQSSPGNETTFEQNDVEVKASVSIEFEII